MMMHALKIIMVVNEIVYGHLPHLPSNIIYIPKSVIFESVFSV